MCTDIQRSLITVIVNRSMCFWTTVYFYFKILFHNNYAMKFMSSHLSIGELVSELIGIELVKFEFEKLHFRYDRSKHRYQI